MAKAQTQPQTQATPAANDVASELEALRKAREELTVLKEELANAKADFDAVIRVQALNAKNAGAQESTRDLSEILRTYQDERPAKNAVPETSPNEIVVYLVFQDVFPSEPTAPIIQAPFALRPDTGETSRKIKIAQEAVRRLFERQAEQQSVLVEKMRIPKSEWNEALLEAATR